jgi:hypothetical protein
VSLVVWIVVLIALALIFLYLWLWRNTPEYAVLTPQSPVEEERPPAVAQGEPTAVEPPPAEAPSAEPPAVVAPPAPDEETAAEGEAVK